MSSSFPKHVAMKYLTIFYKNVETIFQLQWKIGNISDMFLQYSVLCGRIQNLRPRKPESTDFKVNMIYCSMCYDGPTLYKNPFISRESIFAEIGVHTVTVRSPRIARRCNAYCQTVLLPVMPDCWGVGESRIYSKRAKKSPFAGFVPQSGITDYYALGPKHKEAYSSL